ncbi:MAG: aldo/keto reductase, partial [Bacilli bacterium]
MKYRKWYDKKIDTSLLGFGAMRFKTDKNGDIDKEKADALIKKAYEAGVNYFDTAMPYTDGKNESFVGESLKRFPRDSFYLATKLSLGYLKTK